MKRFFTFLKTELKLSLRDMNMPIFAIIMPLVIFIILGIIYGTKPAYDGADYTFMEQSFGAVSAVAICASGLMGLPLAVSDLREMKILKRLRVTPVSPVFILGVELTMYIVYCAVSLATLSVAALLWGVRLHGSLLTFLGSWALTMLSTLSIGMLAGGVAKDTKQASVIASILYFPMLIFSGTTLPIEVMPKAMQKIVSVFPLTQGLTMMKNTFLGIGTGKHPAAALCNGRSHRALYHPCYSFLPLGIELEFFVIKSVNIVRMYEKKELVRVHCGTYRNFLIHA